MASLRNWRTFVLLVIVSVACTSCISPALQRKIDENARRMADVSERLGTVKGKIANNDVALDVAKAKGDETMVAELEAVKRALQEQQTILEAEKAEAEVREQELAEEAKRQRLGAAGNWLSVVIGLVALAGGGGLLGSMGSLGRRTA